jgi:hypothetical protein
MLASLFRRKHGASFPQVLYDLTLDLFAVVQYWWPPVDGPQRGRLFETLLGKYCDSGGLPVRERPGSRTIRGTKSASGFMHENDTVLGFGGFTIHFELKHLATEVSKNDLLIFNQKGLDYLMSEDTVFRKTPLYRIFLSGGVLSREARRFALQWGILAIEPDWLPLVLLHYLSGRAMNNLRDVPLSAQDEIWDEVPNLIAPLQKRVNRAAELLGSDEPLLMDGRIDRALDYLQRKLGDHYWDALDELDPTWLESRFDEIADATGIDRW